MARWEIHRNLHQEVFGSNLLEEVNVPLRKALSLYYPVLLRGS